MNSRRKRPVPFQTKRLVAPRTGVGGVLKITGENLVTVPDVDSGKGPSVLPSSRTEVATQHQEGDFQQRIDEEGEDPSPDPGHLGSIPFPPQPTPERFFSSWAHDMSGEGVPGTEFALPHLTAGRAPQFAIQAPPTAGSKIRASTTPAAKRLPGISEPTDVQNYSGRKTTLPPYYVKSSVEDVERLPAIHPSVWSSRGEKRVEYRGFVTAPPVTDTPPTTAPRKGSALQLNTIALKRPSAVQKKEETPAPCWRCALHLEHSKCETTKYIRIGGGYRHSYWFVRQMIERARQEELRQLSLLRGEQRKIFQEKLMWRVGADGKRERRIKTFVRTKSGRKVVKYQYVPEDVFEDMMQLREGGSESAKRRLQERLAAAGISEDQIDTNWDPNDIGLDDIAMDEEGNLLLDEYGEPIDMADTEKVERAMERRRKERRVRRGSDGSYADSGLAFDEKEERERRRRRDGELSDESESEVGGRRRAKKKGGGGWESESDEEGGTGRGRRGRKKGGAHDDWDSDESAAGGGRKKKGGKKNQDDDSAYSGDSAGKGRRKKKGGKGKYGDDDEESEYGAGGRRKKGKKGRGGGGDDFSDDDDSVGGGKKKGKKGKKKGGHGGDDSESESDSGGGKKGRKKGKKGKGKGGDYSDSDDDDGEGGHGGRGKKGRKKKGKGGGGDDDYSDDDSHGGGGGRRKKKGRKGRRDGSYSGSDYSGEDGEGGGKHGKHRKHRSRRRDSRSGSRSGSSDGEGGRRRKGGRRRRGHRHGGSGSDSYSRSRSGSRSRRRRGKGHRRHRHGDDDDSGSYSRSRSGSRSRRRGKHRSRRRDGSDYGSGGSSYDSGDSRGGHRRRRGKKGRRHRHRSRGGSSGSEYSDDEEGGRRRHRKHRSRRHRHRDGSGHSDYSSRTPSGSEYDDDGSRRGRRHRKKKHRSRRRHSSDDYSDYSDGDRKSRRRRHRRRHSSDSRSYSDSEESDRSRRRRRRRHRRRRSDDSGASSGDESDRSRRRRRRRHRRHRSGSEGSDYSSESDRSRRRRRRHRRHRDGSEDSGSESDRSRRRRRHRRRRHDDSDYSDSGSDRSRRRRRRHRRRSYSGSSSRSRHRSRRHRRHRRRSDSDSTSYSDDSSYDSRSRRRRHRRHRRHSSDSRSDYSDDSRRDRRRRKDKKDRRRRRYSTSTEESSAGDEKPSKRDRRRDRRKKYYSDSETDSDDSYRSRGHRKKKHRKPPRPPSTSSSDLSSEASSAALRGMTKEKRREYERRRREKIERKERRREMREEYDRYVEKKEKRKERRARRERGEPVSDSSSDSYWGDGKTAVKYGKGSRRHHDRKDSDDYRDIGYDDPNDPWRKKDRRRKDGKKDRSRRGAGKSSDEGDSSASEFYIDDTGKSKKKEKKKRAGKEPGDISSDSEESIYEDVFNEDGTVERKKIRVPKQKNKKQRVYDDDELDQESEYESIDSADADKLVARQIYDKDGEVIRLTRSGRRIKDGKISKEVFDLEKHKQKKEKKKKEKQLLEQSYEEEYVEEFIDDEGQVVRVVKKRLKGQTAPGRRPTTPLTGSRRVQVLFLKGGKHLQKRLNALLESCPLNVSGPGKRLRPISAGSDDFALDLDERDSKIDYLSHYQLVDPAKLETYGKAFVVEDTDENNVLNLNETKVALEGIPSLQGLGPRQMHYILKILGIDDATMVTFKMFAVVCALCERLLEVIDDQTKQWMEIDDLMDLERKLELYRQMFYWNICSERSPNYIKASSLRVELIAGGVSRRQEDEVMARIETNVYREVSFIDYMAFVPLFLCAHENIIENPLDDSRDKFKGDKEYVFVPERDMVPLGRPMTRSAAFDMKSIPIPYIFEKRPGSSPRKRFKLTLPKPPVEEVPTPDSLATPILSPVPPKTSRLEALKKRLKRI